MLVLECNDVTRMVDRLCGEDTVWLGYTGTSREVGRRKALSLLERFGDRRDRLPRPGHEVELGVEGFALVVLANVDGVYEVRCY